MSALQKLTKKQRKSLAFREKKGKGKAANVDDEARDIPVLENLDLESEGVPNPIVYEALSNDILQLNSASKKGKEKDHEGSLEQKSGGKAREQSRKRKRSQQEAEDAGEAGRSSPKLKKPKSAPQSRDENNEGTESEERKKGKEEKKARYILFVGMFPRICA